MGARDTLVAARGEQEAAATLRTVHDAAPRAGIIGVGFEQERPETLRLDRRGTSELVTRDPETLSPAAATYAIAPAGHPQGCLDCFDLFVGDTYAAMGGEPPNGLPTFADGARSAHLIDAVLASAAAGAWVEVP